MCDCECCGGKKPKSTKVKMKNESMVKFAKKYLKGCGMRATEKNINNVINSMTAEGVVFQGKN